MTKVVQSLIILMCIVILIVIIRRHSVTSVIKSTRSRASSSGSIKKVTFRKMLNLLAENAATPPVFSVNQTCQPKILPKYNSKII